MKMITEGLNEESMIFLNEITNPTDNVEIQYLATNVDRQFQDKKGLGWISHVIANSTRPLHVLRHMIPFGFPVNLADNNGAMPLHYTVKNCKNDEDKLGLILILLANGAKVDAKTSDESMTALMMACCLGDVQSAELLLARGASIHATALESQICAILLGRQHSQEQMHFLTDYSAIFSKIKVDN
jgi:ankyrin repeat protein